MDNLDKKELLRRKEIVEWQIRIAKDYDMIRKRENELKEIDKQLKILQNEK